VHALLVTEADRPATPIRFVDAATWPRLLEAGLSPTARAFATAQGFDAKGGAILVLPGEGGAIETILVPLGPGRVDPFLPGRLPGLLPAGLFAFEGWPGDEALATIAFLLGAYTFDRYRGQPRERAFTLLVPPGVDAAEASRIAQGVTLGRDLVNTPASDLRPAALEAAARALAARHGAEMRSIVGDALLRANLPMIHAVGRASPESPRLVDIQAGDPAHPKVTLVGKGVTFDTGGLDLKPSSAMLLMKKDMGGAATALAAAHMILDARLPVRLRVLLPIVENAVAGAAFRPGDVLASRKGLSVEIGNTDAEGRLILADALALADEDAPDLLLDFATLTGAARVALGPDIVPLYTSDDGLAADLMRLSGAVNDPIWRMPLWAPYASMLDSKIADTNNVSSGGFAGSITAALFLSRFVSAARAWAHFDVYAWTPKAGPGRPEGGEAQVARLVYALLAERYAPR